MNTLVRNTTLGFSRRRADHGVYEPLDQSYAITGDDYYRINLSTSRRKVTSVDREYLDMETNNFSYKRERAKKRMIYLQSYKLGSSHKSSRDTVKPPKLKEAAAEVKSVAESFVSFIRISSVRVCRSKSADSVFSPRPSPAS